MNKNILVPLLLVTLVVFLSGCEVAPSTGGQVAGVVVTSFGPDIPEIYSGDDVTFNLMVENVGEEDATVVQAKLFGLGTDWTWTKNYRNVNPTTLLKSQPEFKVPGGVGDLQWTTTSPSDLRVDTTYTAAVRVKYDYETTAYGSIKLYHKDYLKTRPEEAASIMKSSGIESFSVTKAPITVSLTGVARPIVSTGGTSASIAILIENVGPGTPFDTTEDDMTITVEKFTVGTTTCVSAGTTKRLPRGGTGSVSCTFTVPSFTDFTTLPVSVELSYSYFIDASSSIKVFRQIS